MDPTNDLPEPEPASSTSAHVRRRSLLVGSAAAVVAVAVAAGAAVAAGGLADDRSALPEPEAEIRFRAEDDESDQPLLSGDRTGEVAPDDELLLLDGGFATFADYAGTPVVVNFFASWCEPCKAELPDFAAVDAELGDEVTFIGVNVRDGEDDARRLMEETGVDFTVVRDPSGSLSEAFGVVNMPSTFFLDADGRIVSSRPGTLSADELRAEIAALG